MMSFSTARAAPLIEERSGAGKLVSQWLS